MDAAELTKLFALVIVLIGLGRFVLTSLDRAEHGFASLFVPPDRALGWPRGVQESDEPWAWRASATEVEDPGLTPPGGPGQRTVLDPPPEAEPRRSLVVPVHPVAPIRFSLRPH